MHQVTRRVHARQGAVASMQWDAPEQASASLIEHARHPEPRQRAVDLDRDAFPREVVDDRQDAEATAIAECV